MEPALASAPAGTSSTASGPPQPSATPNGQATPAASAPKHPPPLFPLREFLAKGGVAALPRTRVVDVGAMFLDEAEEVWRPLQRRGHCESVVGFEPCSEECDRLNTLIDSLSADGADGGSSSCVFKFLPWALGDGSRGQFRRCSAAMTSSMLEPNIPLLRRFVQLEEVTTVVERSEMETRRLDDLLPQIPGRGVDYLKIDVQGFELSVLKGAEQALKDVLVVHTEALKSALDIRHLLPTAPMLSRPCMRGRVCGHVRAPATFCGCG